MSPSTSFAGLMAAGLLLLTGAFASPPLPIFEKELVLATPKAPKFTINNPITNKPIRYFEIDIKNFDKKVYDDKPAFTALGYDGQHPGPLIKVTKGEESVIRFVNRRTDSLGALDVNVHLHGSPSRAPFDGFADDLIQVNQFKDYYYPNSMSARMLWYHDHANHHTANNVDLGLAGLYIIEDPAEAALNLPSGEFDVPLAITSKFYDDNGVLQPGGGGDVIEVNGVAWPKLTVQPRKYRLRFLNADIIRNFDLSFKDAAGTAIPFTVIASDAGLFNKPVTSSNVGMSSAERYEVVIDFKPFAGANVDLRNSQGVSGDEDPQSKVIRFAVAAGPVQDPSEVKPTLGAELPAPHPGVKTKEFKFNFSEDGKYAINGIPWDDVNNRVLHKVPRGTIEQWIFNNEPGGEDHPVHTHLVDFRIISRTGPEGTRPLLPYESAGLKDTVWLGAANEIITVEAHYAPWDGLYMMHCHNLQHEDSGMMGGFDVTKIEDLGYVETDYRDPMDARWRAKPVTDDAFTEASIRATVDAMAKDKPYSDEAEVMQRLKEYWATKTPTAQVAARTPGPVAKKWVA